jgi:Flp pilus assembly pilin Flp
MVCSAIKRFIASEDGMEMVEWSIVGVVFAVAAAVFWTELATRIDAALGSIEDQIDPGGSAP